MKKSSETKIKRLPFTTQLSSTVTVANYREYEEKHLQKEIAEFIKQRFTERYIAPLQGANKHGFSMIAVCCLMIEALESFWQGKEDTRNISKAMFQDFFSRNSDLADFNDFDFYHNIRCGVLHQAETREGWLISRLGKDPLLDLENKIINATKFQKKLEIILEVYCQQLTDASWNDHIWKMFRFKMNAVCRNCGA